MRSQGTQGCLLRSHILDFERRTSLKVSCLRKGDVGGARHGVEVQDLDNHWGRDPFKDELGNSIANVDLEVVVVVVEEEKKDSPSVVRVNDTSADLNGALNS